MGALAWIVLGGIPLVAEWRFEYHQGGEDKAFLGASIATEREGKIAELREYAVTDDPYTWTGGWR